MGQMGLPWMGAQSSSNSILSWAHEAWALDPQPLPRASIHLHSDFRCLLLSLCSRVWPASVVTVDSPSVLGFTEQDKIKVTVTAIYFVHY